MTFSTPGTRFLNFSKNGIEYVPVIFPDIAGDLCQIISARRKMFAEADIFYITGFLYLKNSTHTNRPTICEKELIALNF